LLEIGAQAITDLIVDPETWTAPQALRTDGQGAEPAEREDDRTGGHAGITRDHAACVDHAEPEKGRGGPDRDWLAIPRE